MNVFGLPDLVKIVQLPNLNLCFSLLVDGHLNLILRDRFRDLVVDLFIETIVWTSELALNPSSSELSLFFAN